MSIFEEDEELPLVSSASEALDVDADKPEGEAAAPAAKSSNADDENGESGALNVVRDVVEEREAKTDAASSAEGEEAGEGADGKTPKEPDDENFSDVPFHKHPRFKALVNQRNGYRENATRYENVQRFMDDNGLTSDEAANALVTFAQAKTDPIGAWATIKPWVQQLLIAAGEVLPADLTERVQKGELTQDAAIEVSKARAQSSSVTTQRSFEQQRSEKRQQTELGQSLYTTAVDWEKDRRVKDPNFEAKFIPLQKEIAYLQQLEGKPKTKDGVAAQLKKAYAAVNASFVAQPKPKPHPRPALRPVVGGQAAGNLREKPTSTLDIIRANRRTGT